MQLLGAAGRQPGRVVGEPAQVVRVQFPELRQLRAEGDARLAGVPFLPALPVLRVALYIEAVAWVEVDVPAQRTGIVVGERIGVVDVVGNLGKRRAVGVGVLVRAFLGRQLPLQALVRRQAVAGVEVEAAEPAAVAQGVTVEVVVEAVVFLAGQRQAEVAVFQGDALAGVPVADAALACGVFQARAGRLLGARVMMLITPINALAP